MIDRKRGPLITSSDRHSDVSFGSKAATPAGTAGMGGKLPLVRWCYGSRMRFVFAIVAVFFITACHGREANTPLGCGGSPPESSRDYANWKARQDAACKAPPVTNVPTKPGPAEEFSGIFQGAMIAETAIVVYVPSKSTMPVRLAAVGVCSGACKSKLDALVGQFRKMDTVACGFRISARGTIETIRGEKYFVPAQIASIEGHPIGKTPYLSQLNSADVACKAK